MGYPDLRSYTHETREWLIGRLCDIESQICGLHMEIAVLTVAEKRAKVESFARSEQSSVTAREREADYFAIDNTAEVIKLRGDLQSYQEERDLIRFLLEETRGRT